MNSAVHNYMKVGLAATALFPRCLAADDFGYDILQRLCEDEFFDVLEINNLTDAQTTKRICHLRQVSGIELGINVQSKQMDEGHNLASLNEDERQRAVQEIIRTIGQAYELGATYLLFSDGYHSYPGLGREADALAALEASLFEICHFAKEQGDLRLNLRNMDRIKSQALIGPSSLAARLIQRIFQQYPQFGLALDLGVLPLLGEGAADALEASKEVISYVQLGNAILDGDHPHYGATNPRFNYPYGEVGVEELSNFLEGLLDVGYLDPRHQDLNTITLKLCPLPGEDPWLVLANAKRCLKRAWQRI